MRGRWWWPEARSGGYWPGFSHWLSRRRIGRPGITDCTRKQKGKRNTQEKPIRPLNQLYAENPWINGIVSESSSIKGSWGPQRTPSSRVFSELYTVKDRKGGYLLTRIFFLFPIALIVFFPFLTLGRLPSFSSIMSFWGFVSQCLAIKQSNKTAFLGDCFLISTPCF